MIARDVAYISSGERVVLHAESQGESTAEAGSVIMLHGLLLGSVATWYFGAARELNRHQVILYDLRGHGNSTVTDSGYDLDSMVEDLHAVMNSYQLSRVSLVGHSFGSVIAAHFSIRYPEKIEKLCLVDMPCDVQKLVAKPFENINDRENLVAALPGDLSEKYYQGKRGVKKLVEKLDKLIFGTSLLVDIGRSPVFDMECWKKLPKNTMALYGDKSDCLHDAELSNDGWVSFQVINGGHFLPLEAGVEVSALIKEYFYG